MVAGRGGIAQDLARQASQGNDSLVQLKRRHALGIGAAVMAAAGTLGWFLLSASAATTPGPTFSFEPSLHRPVAGQLFIGLVVVDIADVPDNFSANCGEAFVGRKHWYGSQRSFFSGSRTTDPPDADAASRNVVVCSWRVPAGASGRRFRIVGASASTAGTTGEPQTFSWRVRH